MSLKTGKRVRAATDVLDSIGKAVLNLWTTGFRIAQQVAILQE
jgi:hypothetical protein